jgi:cytochrome P450
MALHPEVQRKAQTQIDEAIGANQLPDFDDRGRLPYVEAIMKELFRWRPPLPVGK